MTDIKFIKTAAKLEHSSSEEDLKKIDFTKASTRVKNLYDTAINYSNLDEDTRNDVIIKFEELLEEDLSAFSETDKALITMIKKVAIEKLETLSTLIEQAYTATLPPAEDGDSQSSSLTKGEWQPLADSRNIKRTIGYYGQAYVNHEEKKIVIVSSGTKAKFFDLPGAHWSNGYNIAELFKDLLNDILVYFRSTPIQFYRGAVPFLAEVINSLEKNGVNLAEYTLISTGHSLGGILADLLTTYALLEYQNTLSTQQGVSKFAAVQSVTFENPGSKPMVINYLTAKLEDSFTPEEALDQVKKVFLVVNNGVNWINGANPQASDPLYITPAVDSAASYETPGSHLTGFIKRCIFYTTMNLTLHASDNFVKIGGLTSGEHHKLVDNFFGKFFREFLQKELAYFGDQVSDFADATIEIIDPYLKEYQARAFVSDEDIDELAEEIVSAIAGGWQSTKEFCHKAYDAGYHVAEDVGGYLKSTFNNASTYISSAYSAAHGIYEATFDGTRIALTGETLQPE